MRKVLAPDDMSLILTPVEYDFNQIYFRSLIDESLFFKTILEFTCFLFGFFQFVLIIY